MKKLPIAKPLYYRLISPLILLFLLIVVLSLWEGKVFQIKWAVVQQSLEVIHDSVKVLLWLSTAWLVVRLIDVVIWTSMIENRTGFKVPRLIKDIVAGLIFFIAFLGIVSFVFLQSVSTIVAASGFVGLIVGLAINNVIADIFDGLSLHFDRPFKIGDFVFLHDWSLNIAAQVMETTWRTTRFQTGSNSILIVPNSTLCQIPISNLSMNNTASFEITFCFNQFINSAKVLDMLMTAAKSAYGILEEPAPSARIENVTPNGINYILSYWIIPAKTVPSMAKNGLIAQVIYLAKLANITFARKKSALYLTKKPKSEFSHEINKHQFIANTKIFRFLDEEDINYIVDHTAELTIKTGMEITSYDKELDSMYILVDGLLSVMIPVGEEKKLEKVTYLASGEYFGEMSLFTGERSSATIIAETNSIVYKMDRQIFISIIDKHPKLMIKISNLMAERRLQNEQFQQEILDLERLERERETLSEYILNKMKKLFSVLTGKSEQH